MTATPSGEPEVFFFGYVSKRYLTITNRNSNNSTIKQHLFEFEIHFLNARALTVLFKNQFPQTNKDPHLFLPHQVHYDDQAHYDDAQA
jgi:hypothetical protein